MRLTQHTDFALRVLIYLGLRQGELSTIKDISAAYGISHNHLMKVVQKLVAREYVESVRGIGGGIRLNLAPGDINVGELVRDMEPDFGLVECFRPENECVITPVCALPRVLDRAMKAFMAELDNATLVDLLPRRRRPELMTLLQVE